MPRDVRLLALGFVLLAAACTSDQLPGTGAPSSASSGTGAPRSAVPGASSSSSAHSGWDLLDEAAPDGRDAVTLSAEATMSGPELPVGATVTGSLGEGAGLDTAPCSLVTAAEVGAWMAQGPVTSTLLEDGAVCGWRGGDDSVRVAIGVMPYLTGSSVRFLPTSVSGLRQALRDGKVVQARWVERYPVMVSSVLVVETATFELVIEMSSRGARTQDELRRAAIQFAELALGRIK